MFAEGADAEGAEEGIAGNDGHAKGAADAGLFGAGLGDAAFIGLEIADGDGDAFGGGFAGDAFADGDGLYDIDHVRWQADLGGEMEELGGGIEFVDGAGFGIELFEGGAEDGFERGVLFELGVELGEEIVHGEEAKPWRAFSVKRSSGQVMHGA